MQIGVQLLVKTLMSQRSSWGSDTLTEAEAYYGVRPLNTFARPELAVTEEHLPLQRALAVLKNFADQAKQVPSKLPAFSICLRQPCRKVLPEMFSICS